MVELRLKISVKVLSKRHLNRINKQAQIIKLNYGRGLETQQGQAYNSRIKLKFPDLSQHLKNKVDKKDNYLLTK